MRRLLVPRNVWLLAVITAAAIGVSLLWMPGKDRVTAENYARIKLGMTRDEVVAILGKPWDDSLFDPEPPTRYWVSGNISSLDNHPYSGRTDIATSDFLGATFWYGDDYMIGAVFDR